MNPKPFSSLNHFTTPVAIWCSTSAAFDWMREGVLLALPSRMLSPPAGGSDAPVYTKPGGTGTSPHGVGDGVTGWVVGGPCGGLSYASGLNFVPPPVLVCGVGVAVGGVGVAVAVGDWSCKPSLLPPLLE